MRQFLTLSLLIFNLNLLGQKYSKCQVFQYSNKDSLNKKLVSEEKFNVNGQLTSYYYKDYQNYVDSKHYNFYNDTLLVKKTSTYGNTDSLKSIFIYNSLGQKIKEEEFVFMRLLKKEVCKIDEEDYELNPTWTKTTVTKFKYDKFGNIILSKEKYHFKLDNKHKWKYDKLNRIIEHCLYDSKNLIWREHFEYFQNGFKFTRTWFDEKGIESQTKPKFKGYWPQYTFIFKMNENGDIIEESTIDENEKLNSMKIILYNSNRQKIRVSTFDSEKKPLTTHLYVYE